MTSSLDGGVLAVATEAGSAKALLPVLDCLVRRGVRVRAYLADNARSLAGYWPALAEAGALEPLVSGLSHAATIGDSRPGALLVGTTALPGIERRLTAYAVARGIPCAAIVDERYGYRRRFAEGAAAPSQLPDIIAVMDEGCFRDAVAEGLPADRLRVTGNPILSYLVHRRGQLTSGAAGSAGTPRRVTFISETFARDNGVASDRPGRLAPFLGFTEDSVREDLIAALTSIGLPVMLTERLHPSDDRVPGTGRTCDGGVCWQQTSGGDLWPLLLNSDAVIGMRSMALLEAGLLGCRVASYQPNLIGDPQCAAVHFGVATELGAPDDLRKWLRDVLTPDSAGPVTPPALSFIRADAAERVADLVLGERT